MAALRNKEPGLSSGFSGGHESRTLCANTGREIMTPRGRAVQESNIKESSWKDRPIGKSHANATLDSFLSNNLSATLDSRADVDSSRSFLSKSSNEPTSPLSPNRGDEQNRPKFDMLRLREWFNQMDSQHSGHVTRRQWMDFMNANPQLGSIMTGVSAIKNTDAQRDAKARQLRAMMKMWQAIDIDKNGTLEWEEFVEFFRVGGYLLVYEEKGNPKDRMAEVLKDLHEGHDTTTDFGEFDDMKNQHLGLSRRRSVGMVEATQTLSSMDQKLKEALGKLPALHTDKDSLTQIVKDIKELQRRDSDVPEFSMQEITGIEKQSENQPRRHSSYTS